MHESNDYVRFNLDNDGKIDLCLTEHIAKRAALLSEKGYTFHIHTQPRTQRTLLSVDRDGDHVALATTPDLADLRLVAIDIIQTAWDIAHIGEYGHYV